MGLFGWWTTRSELETLGRQLSEMFAKRVPVARVDDANLVGREIGIIASHAVGIRRKKGLGVFGQAKLANTIRWALVDKGYESGFADHVARGIVARTANDAKAH